MEASFFSCNSHKISKSSSRCNIVDNNHCNNNFTQLEFFNCPLSKYCQVPETQRIVCLLLWTWLLMGT